MIAFIIFTLLVCAIVAAAVYQERKRKKEIEELRKEEERKAEEAKRLRRMCVEMVVEGTSLRKVSRDMGVPYSTLRNWVRKDSKKQP